MCVPFEWTVRSTAQQVHLLHLLSGTRIWGMGIYVLALYVFVVATFPCS